MNQIKKSVKSEIEQRAGFSQIRYAQCWEDADILLQALNIKPEDQCLAIASAGDNALAMLSKAPKKVIALDMNPAQLACLDIRVAAYKTLDHHELLQLMGSRPDKQRLAIYKKCRPALTAEGKRFWDANHALIEAGIGSAGKFEHYFRMFRKRIMPLIHNKKRIARLLGGGEVSERQTFYDREWNNLRWRLLFRVFFSRWMMGRMGRDPAFFRYVKGSVASRILQRTRYALTALDPKDNPYLQWILTGKHVNALPYALRKENFSAIRENIDRIEWHLMPVEAWMENNPGTIINKFNLSDIFEYMSSDNYIRLLDKLVRTSAKGGRLVYWNMLAPRRRPEAMANRLASLDELAEQLFKQDKAFFYSAFVVEEIL